MAEMFEIDLSELKQFESDLKTFAARALPFATKATVNGAAFDAQKGIRAEIREKMINRNKFTERSIRVVPTKTLKISQQEAIVGSIAPYMADQEFGGVKRKKGKHGTPIPTTVASGEGRGAQPRKRAVPRSRTMGRIRLPKTKIRAKNKKQENIIKIKVALEKGRKLVFLDMEKHPGIYRISGGKRKPQIDLIQDLSEKSVRIPSNPTFAPATKATGKKMDELYLKAIIFQLKRHNLFKK